MTGKCWRCTRTAELDSTGRCVDRLYCGRCVLSDLQNARPHQRVRQRVTLSPSEEDVPDVEPAYGAATKADDEVEDERGDRNEALTGRRNGKHWSERK